MSKVIIYVSNFLKNIYFRLTPMFLQTISSGSGAGIILSSSYYFPSFFSTSLSLFFRQGIILLIFAANESELCFKIIFFWVFVAKVTKAVVRCSWLCFLNSILIFSVIYSRIFCLRTLILSNYLYFLRRKALLLLNL